MRFYAHSPRIDFVTETENLPSGTIVSAEFPLRDEITEIRRGIPYGFSHGAWSKPNPDLHGRNRGIVPVIRWSHYTLAGGGGVAVLDRGVPGREVVGGTVYVLLLNATNEYFWDKHATWLMGEEKHRFEYALVAHQEEWPEAGIPRIAWDYNAQPLVFSGVAASRTEAWVEVSSNLVLQALRRTGDEIELRLVECLGVGGQAGLKTSLPHQGAALTNLVGGDRASLEPVSQTEGRTEYRFRVRPQQIVTLRLKASEAVPAIKTLRTFDPVVPEAKRAATRGFDHPELKGHPPREGRPLWLDMAPRKTGAANT